jgi:glycosyltransferase involved in cell wall biosynthesis
VIRHVAVVVPAHDEADRIGDAIDAIARARGRLPRGVTSATFVVVDGCRDNTVAVARRHLDLRTDRIIETTERSVGAARMEGSRQALDSSSAPPDRTWLASTDADTIVPADWLCRQIDEAASGAAALAGTVSLRSDEDVHPVVRGRFATTYQRGLVDGHSHVHGANLGVRGDVYLAAGGWRALEHSEDHDLWRRIVACAPVRSLASLTVATSPRSNGRAPSGFAADLDALVDPDGAVA